MPTIYDSQSRAALARRMDTLTPDRTPAWGRMHATQMVAHLAGALKMGLGELLIAPRATPFSRWPMNAFVMHIMPWPKGAPTAPELLMRDATGWEAQRVEFHRALQDFGARGASGIHARHPAFGSISGKDWGRLMHRHIDWHLRQFGA